LTNVSKRRGSKMIEDRLNETTAAALFHEAERSVCKSHRCGFAVDALRQYLRFALRPDFLGRALVSSSCTFFNAYSPEGAAYDPIG
jgi:hypothetical protein